MAEWIALSVDKRVRWFSNAKRSWREAAEICEANAGKLLTIESEEENHRVTELLGNLNGGDSANRGEQQSPIAKSTFLYWIGAQAMRFYSLPPDTKYTNFDADMVVSRSANNGSLSAEETVMLQRQFDHTETTTERGGCAAISTSNATKGKWLSRDCSERHNFICQQS